MSIKRRNSKTAALDSLRDLLIRTGLYNLPSIDEEYAYLAESLTADQLYTVLRLLDGALQFTHNVGHLPHWQALEAIRENIKPPMPSNKEGVPS